MNDEAKPEVGTIAWTDLTVADAEGIRDFYAKVLGWVPAPVDMGTYSDFTMTTPDDQTAVAGVCHARGGNADLPAQWLNYVIVADLDRSMRQCEESGGEIVAPARTMGTMGRYCVIRDPAGAVLALFELAG
ncbi:MAG: VOC family protein [Gemmatimonadota bacterium]|nr:VOC family protein [Gemmatimonadota bacterium]